MFTAPLAHGDKRTRVLLSVLWVLGMITMPLWILPYLWVRTPSRAERADYAAYSERMKTWEPHA